MQNITQLIKNKITIILFVAIALVLIIIGFFAFKIFAQKAPAQAQDLPEIDLNFDPEGPYAVLVPRRDGNAMTINITRTASYDSISYELAYNASGVDRGVRGDINIKDKMGEYEQEVLFGTCSTGGKCVFDQGVENGTLTLHIKKGNQPYRLVTQWHLQKPDLALGTLISGDGHFIYQLDAGKNDLSLIKFSIINDLSGAPKLLSNKQIVGKVYSLSVPVAKNFPEGQVTIELSDKPPAGTKIAFYDENKSEWVELDSKVNNNKISAKTSTGGIFTVFASPQS